MPLIELKNISKIYKLDAVNVPAVIDATLAIERGEFVAIMGPSGSGKSTLMNIIGLLDRSTSGSYRLEGQEISPRLGDRALARLRSEAVGFVFQTFNLLPNIDVLGNVVLPAMYASRRYDARRRGQELLKRVGLGHRLSHHPSQLSGGERQRVAIARALMNEPKIVLADEPTGNLDSKSGAEVIDILQDLNRRGTTLLLVTHNQELANRANRIVHLKDGKIVHAPVPRLTLGMVRPARRTATAGGDSAPRKEDDDKRSRGSI